MTSASMKTLDEKVAGLQRTVKKQQTLLGLQAQEIEDLRYNLVTVLKRTDMLKSAVPHVSFGDW